MLIIAKWYRKIFFKGCRSCGHDIDWIIEHRLDFETFPSRVGRCSKCLDPQIYIKRFMGGDSQFRMSDSWYADIQKAATRNMLHLVTSRMQGYVSPERREELVKTRWLNPEDAQAAYELQEASKNG